ncbi:MAG TPA: NAD(P)-binding domain-containing protein [Candidatus Nanopelagicales bacterium]
MQIAVLGTGSVGRALAARLDELGHDVTLGTRSPAATLSRSEPDPMGNPTFAVWGNDHPGVRLATFADAAADAELVINATNGSATLEVLDAAGEDHLGGKVLVDVSNPLDFSAGFPPTLFVKDSDSLGEQVQRAFPTVRVVKALNTMTASLMVHPESLGATTTVFICGDDPAAKAAVTALLTAMGHRDVLDLGGIEAARGTEMYLPLWLRMMGALGTGMFNIRVVR